jgi:hypothetical protein
MLTKETRYTQSTGRPTRSYKGTVRPPWTDPEVWQFYGKKRKSLVVDKAIKEGLYWGDAEPVCCAAVASEEASNVHTLSDPSWALYCNEHGLTLDGDLTHNVGSCDIDDLMAELSTSDELDDENVMRSRRRGVQPHRPKAVHNSRGIWNACVTKQIHPREAAYHSAAAQEALKSELEDIRARDAWGESEPVEGYMARRMYDNAQFAHVFAIMGVKNSEMSNPDLHKYKARVVLGGNNIRTSNVEFAIFDDVGSVPAAMSAARTLMALNEDSPVGLCEGIRPGQAAC